MMGNVVKIGGSSWRDQLQWSSTGGVRQNLFNACVALRGAPAFAGAIRRDDFGMQTVVAKPLPWSDKADMRPWTEHDDLYATEWLQGEDIQVKREIVQQAVETVAHENRFHPVRDWLESLKWDGTPRVDDWLTYYLGAEPDERTPAEYIQTVGRCWLISAVARIFRPGCKADHVVVIEGRQGLKKSTAIKTLCGEAWFTDELADFGSKDAAMQMRGVWIIELSEMDHMGRSEVKTAKAFISRTTDRFRPPYGMRLVTAPRECVFAGTVNGDEYLRDETGNRRFWPVRAQSIDIDALAADREQIWAEAVALFRRGEAWWIVDDAVERAAKSQQAARNERDVWAEVVEAYIARLLTPWVTVSEILQGPLKMPIDRHGQAEKNRVSRILQNAGWERARSNPDSAGRRPWGYRPKPPGGVPV